MKRLMFLLLMAFAVASAQPVCSLDTIRGTYAVSYYGALTMMQQGAPPMTATGGIVGVLSIDYSGVVSGLGAVSGLGPVTDYEVAGTAQFTNNCTGKISMKMRPKGAKDWTGAEVDRFVADPDGKTLVVIVVDMGQGVYPAIQGTWNKISSVPNAVSW